MSTMKSKRRPEPGAEPEGHEPPQEVFDRLAGLLPEGALEDAVKGLRPERKQQMPRNYSPEVRRQVIELARAGTKVKQLAETFAMSDATIYNWLKQDRIDRGEAEGATTSQQLELTAARRRIKLPPDGQDLPGHADVVRTRLGGRCGSPAASTCSRNSPSC